MLELIISRFTHGFLRALNRINTRRPSTTREICKRYRRVRVAADASMAVAVGSKRAWSRSMLLKMRLRIRRRSRRDFRVTKNKKKISSSDQAEELRGLVPGGEAMEICKLLDETAHYIKCLSTQVKNRQAVKEEQKKTDLTVEKRTEKIIPCPRCKSMETKFCYFSNYNVNQPRHFCKGCQRYWASFFKKQMGLEMGPIRPTQPVK